MGNQPHNRRDRDRIPAHWEARRREERFRSVMRILFVIFGAVALFYIVFLAATVESLEKPDVTFKDFSGGINTKDNPFSLKPNEYLQMHNYVLDAEYVSAALRPGDVNKTDSIAITIAADSILLCSVITAYAWFPVEPEAGSVLVVLCDKPVPEIDNFLLGIGADSSDGAAPLGEAFTIKNSFQDINDNSLTMRIVKDAGVSPLTTADSISVTISQAEYAATLDTGGITGLYAFYSKPTTKLLMYVVPGFGAKNQWSSLYSSKASQYEPSILLSDFIYKGETPLWETWNNWVYIALPRQRPMISNGTRTAMMVPRAPGQLEIVPAQPDTPTGAWTIDGAPRYGLFRRHADTGAGEGNRMTKVGKISHAVPLYNEWGLIYGFPREASDANNNAVRSDSVLLDLVRTRGDPNSPPKEFDSLFLIATITSGDPSILDTLKIIDSVPNDSLGTSTYPFVGTGGVIPYDTGYVNTQTDVRDTTGSATINQLFTAPGSPTLIAQKQGDTTNDFWPLAAKIDSSNREHIGWEYGITRFDTTIDLPLMSDMSPTLVISTAPPVNLGGKDSTTAIWLGIPRRTALDSGMATVVWRRQIKYAPNIDSFTVTTDTFYVWEFPGGGEFRSSESQNILRSDPLLDIITTVTYSDSLITKSAFFPVGVILTNDTIFYDSLSWSDMMAGGRTNKDVAIDPRWNPLDNRMAIVKGFFGFKDHLFAWTDNAIFRSTLDTPVFKLFSDISFDPENGDVITQVTHIGPNIVVFWSNGLTELYDPSGQLPTKGSPVSGLGCIAPQSLINHGGIIYFMSKDGIRAMASHQVKNYGVTNPLISRKINDQIVDGKTDSLKSTMVAGIGTGGKTIVFTYPSISKMYQYYPELDSWTTRDGSFFQATNYDTTQIEGLLHSSTMLYARTGDQRVFDYQTKTLLLYDSGLTSAAYTGVIETRPVSFTPNVHEVKLIGVLKAHSGGDQGTFTIKNDSGTTLVTEAFPGNDPVYSVHGVKYNEASIFTFQWATSIGTAPDTIRQWDFWTKYVHGPRIR